MADGMIERLRGATRELHAKAERSGVMAELLRGRLARASYCDLLRNLFEIYQALESALLATRGMAEVAPIVFPSLFRTHLIVQDLEVFHPAGWREELEVMPAAQDYAARIGALSRDHPELLIAHTYVRTLGDLSGGQVLHDIVARAYALRGNEGTRFYDFGSVVEVASAKRELRDGIASIPADDLRIEAIVSEARLAFQSHITLFEELARSRPRSVAPHTLN